MQSNGIFMWWLKQNQIEEQEHKRPRLYVEPPVTYEFLDVHPQEEKKEESPRVIIIDL